MNLYHYVAGKLVPMTPEEASTVPADWPLRAVDNFLVPLTAAEIDQRARDEEKWRAGAPIRELRHIEEQSGMSRKDRDLAALLPAGHFLRVKAEATEAAIIALGVRK